MFYLRYFLIGTISLVVCNLFFNSPVFAAPVADHTVISQFSSLSKSAIDVAAAKKILFYHQSTGNNIVYMGLNCLSGTGLDSNLAAECDIYRTALVNNSWPYYNWSNWTWQIWPEPMADAKAKMDQFVSLVHQNQANYQYIGMKFCYVDGFNLDFTYYRDEMLKLEARYPTKTFIWSTSVLNTGSHINNSTIQAFNDAVRVYAKANNKPLYDMSAIESKGGSCKAGGHDVLCQEYWDSWGGDQGGHPDRDGSLVLAKGFWWLIANLDSNSPPPTSFQTPSSTPSPIIGDLDDDSDVDIFDYNLLVQHFNTTNCTYNLTGSCLIDIFDYNLLIQNFGS